MHFAYLIGMKQEIKREIKQLADRGAIFYVSHSGGKDSQTMFIKMSEIVPLDQIVVIHAHLPEVVWAGEQDHIRNTIGNTQFIVCQAVKTFFEMVDHRQKFPAPAYRQCTSDLKRGPLDKVIRHDLKAKGKKLAVSCMGIRAQESPGRAKQTPFKLHKRLSIAGREVYDMLPIHDFLLENVWATIKEAGQEPHWAYGEGMERLSCCFCIMASVNDLTTAARINPELYARYVRKERELNFTVRHGQTLEEVTGIYI